MQSLIDTSFALQRSGAVELLLPLLLKATLIALIGRLVIAAVPRASAATRYLVALTTLAALLLLTVMTIALPSWRLAILPADAKQNVEGPAARPAPSALPATAPTLAAQPSLAQELSPEAPRVLRAAAVVADSGAQVATFLGALRASWRGWLLLAVLAIGTAMLARLAGRLRGLRHPRRRDAVTLLVTRAAAAIWWFHPVVWSLDRTARRDCEQACDDLVLGAGTLASDYADHLLNIDRKSTRLNS